MKNYLVHHILGQDLGGGGKALQSNDCDKFPCKRMKLKNNHMFAAPALVEHGFSLKLAHVLLSQFRTPYKVPKRGRCTTKRGKVTIFGPKNIRRGGWRRLAPAFFI